MARMVWDEIITLVKTRAKEGSVVTVKFAGMERHIEIDGYRVDVSIVKPVVNKLVQEVRDLINEPEWTDCWLRITFKSGDYQD